MFLKKAMRYYRLWIYTCNAVLLVSVLVFLGVAAGILSHRYLALVPTPPPYHPTLLYGYGALFLQAGVLQAIGCFGALKLNQKLLSTYWLLLLSLLIGDLIVGLIWLVKFNQLMDGVTPFLNITFKTYYNKDPYYTQVLDALQSDSKCCGVDNPLNYYNNTDFTILPNSCCPTAVQAYHEPKIPPKPPIPPTKNETSPKKIGADEHIKNTMKQLRITCRVSSDDPNLKGCAEHVKRWYKDSTETLMILGFCVITFIKLCFVGILRFEIQEMIQKIKVLQGETIIAPNPELAAALGMISPTQKKPEGGLVTTIEEEPSKIAIPNVHKQNHIGPNDGADSDTNSHCALITDTPVRNANPPKRKPNGNNNELTELRELRHVRQTQI